MRQICAQAQHLPPLYMSKWLIFVTFPVFPVKDIPVKNSESIGLWEVRNTVTLLQTHSNTEANYQVWWEQPSANIIQQM